MYIFLYGADTFRSTEKMHALKNKYFEKNSSGTDLSVLDYESNSEIKNLESILSNQGLFSSKRLVIIKNCLLKGSLEKQKELQAFFKSNPALENDADSIVIFFEEGSPKKNLSLLKFLLAHSKKQEFVPLDGAHLTNWALAYAKNISPEISFSRSALNLLLSETGNDLHSLSNEISKLANYKQGKTISNEDILMLVKAKMDSTIFETIESLLGGNKKRTLDLFHQQLTKGEDVFYILSMYIYQIRTLLKIGDLYWQGLTNATEIARVSKLHPYVVQKSLAQIRNVSEHKIKQMFRDLAKIDQDAKIGKVDPVLALDSFIVSI